MVRKNHSICAGIQGLIIKGTRWLLKLKWEAQGKKKGGKQDRQELKEKNQRRSLSSSCMVFLMRRSIVVSHWSNREMESNSFTCQIQKKYE